MITQISGPNTVGVTKDPRRKAQSVRFKKNTSIASHSSTAAKGYSDYARQQKNALWTSVSIVLGSIVFTVGYFTLSALKKVKK